MFALLIYLLLSLLVGYLGRRRSIGFIGSFAAATLLTPVLFALALWMTAASAAPAPAISAAEGGPVGPIKQVILIRKDLKMRRGKEIAQGSHASLEFLAARVRPHLGATSLATVEFSAAERAWLTHGMAKVCLQVASEDELAHYHNKAEEHGLASYLIRDSGRTEFGGVPTLTACAIGPDEVAKIDEVTADLALY